MTPLMNTQEPQKEASTSAPEAGVSFGGETFNLNAEADRLRLLRTLGADTYSGKVRRLIPLYATSNAEEREMILAEIQKNLPETQTAPEIAPVSDSGVPLGGTRPQPVFEMNAGEPEVPKTVPEESAVNLPEVEEIKAEKADVREPVDPVASETEEFLKVWRDRLNEVEHNPALYTVLQDALQRVEDAKEKGAKPEVIEGLKARVRVVYDGPSIPAETQVASVPVRAEPPLPPQEEIIVRPPETAVSTVEPDFPDEDEAPAESADADRSKTPWETIEESFAEELAKANDADGVIAHVLSVLEDDAELRRKVGMEEGVAVSHAIIPDPDPLRDLIQNTISEGEKPKEIPEAVAVHPENTKKVEPARDAPAVSADDIKQKPAVPEKVAEEEQKADLAPEMPEPEWSRQEKHGNLTQGMNDLLDPLFGETKGVFMTSIVEGSGLRSSQWKYIEDLPMSEAITDGAIGFDELKKHTISGREMQDIVRFLEEVRKVSGQRVLEGELVGHYLKRVGQMDATEGFEFRRITH